ncbi:MAG: nucleotidyltransferase family protein [Promethearchaeota archaeon]
MNKAEVLKTLKKNVEILKKYHVKKIGLFGSVLKGNNTSESDIDLIVEFNEGKKNYNNFIDLVSFLEELFQKRVELLTIEALSPYMKPKILEEAYFESF